MFQIIAGEKGKGKTKLLISKANEDIYETKGSLVYLDKNNKHMYELSNKIRLINTRDYSIDSANEFCGFISGVISSDHDLEKVYFDSFLKIGCIKIDELESILNKLKDISDRFNIDFILSISLNKENIPESFHDKIVVAL
ncbi:hypothetical protein lbkm_0925 [Lachnospiraceae bacterium KM106-2]|nr:hypothetical protein lbkm_0925 [Lachnospiraceae bacterium KM106-2]